jgi:hypothetical protein
MNAEHTAKFANGAIEHPTCVVPLVVTEVYDAAIVRFDRGEEFTACSTHCPEALRELLLALEVANLCGKKLSYAKHRLNAMLGELHFRRHVQHAPILKKSQHAASSYAFRLGRVPLDAEDWNAQASDTGHNLAKLHSASGPVQFERLMD